MKRVLVVDDSRFMRRFLEEILTRNGYEIVGEAENGKVAIEKYKELSPDVVTMDITMKVMTGLDALREILAFDKNAKVVMVSAMGQQPYVEEAIEKGASGFMVKPFEEKKVIAALEALFK